MSDSMFYAFLWNKRHLSAQIYMHLPHTDNRPAEKAAFCLSRYLLRLLTISSCRLSLI